jgi:hypothetical protein
VYVFSYPAVDEQCDAVLWRSVKKNRESSLYVPQYLPALDPTKSSKKGTMRGTKTMPLQTTGHRPHPAGFFNYLFKRRGFCLFFFLLPSLNQQKRCSKRLAAGRDAARAAAVDAVP